jgi:hypothetical protein
MTKLEEDIKAAFIESQHGLTSDMFDVLSKAAAVVAKKRIENAYDQALIDLSEIQLYYKDPEVIAHMTAHSKESTMIQLGVIPGDPFENAIPGGSEEGKQIAKDQSEGMEEYREFIDTLDSTEDSWYVSEADVTEIMFKRYVEWRKSK